MMIQNAFCQYLNGNKPEVQYMYQILEREINDMPHQNIQII